MLNIHVVMAAMSCTTCTLHSSSQSQNNRTRTVVPSVSRSNNWVNGCSAALTHSYIAARCDVTTLTTGTRRGRRDKDVLVSDS